MKKLISQRYLIRQNLVTIIGFCLCAYFSYHSALGTRSYFGAQKLKEAIAETTMEYESLHEQRLALQTKVERLRPDSLDRDLLEERARTILGYTYPDEQIIIRSN